MQDTPLHTRHAQRQLVLSHTELARRVDVSHDMNRNMEQGKRCLTAAERTQLWVLDKVPETVLRVLT